MPHLTEFALKELFSRSRRLQPALGQIYQTSALLVLKNFLPKTEN
jgi:hypothetical protein